MVVESSRHRCAHSKSSLTNTPYSFPASPLPLLPRLAPTSSPPPHHRHALSRNPSTQKATKSAPPSRVELLNPVPSALRLVSASSAPCHANATLCRGFCAAYASIPFDFKPRPHSSHCIARLTRLDSVNTTVALMHVPVGDKTVQTPPFLRLLSYHGKSLATRASGCTRPRPCRS